MNRLSIIGTIVLLACIILACNNENEKKSDAMKLEYPVTRKVDTVDDYHGTKVSDPYRWLENDTATDVAEWVEAQNKVTFAYLESIPYRTKIKDRLTKLWNFEKQSAPFRKGDRYYYYRNDGLQNQSVLYVMDQLGDSGRVFLDPNTLSDDGTVALAGLSFDKDGNRMAYSIARGGSDWNEIMIRDVATGKDLEDHLKWVKFSSLSWHGEGFYYSGYDRPEEGKELSLKNEYHKVYYHKLGTPQSEDAIIYENRNEPLRTFYAQVTDDEKLLVVYESAATHGNALHIKKLGVPSSSFITVVGEMDCEYSVIGTNENVLFVKTNRDAPRYKLISLSIDKLENPEWKEVIPQSADVLESVSMIGGKLITTYMHNAQSVAYVCSYEGVQEKEIELPAIGSVDGFMGRKEDSISFYSFSSFTFPSVVYKYDFSTGMSEKYFSPQIDFDPELYETNQVFFKSKDGTEIPMFIVHKKGIVLDGNNPTLLYGYGGFNISLTPSFKTRRLVWLENGGIYVSVNLRGGGEFGEEWHQAGTKLNKQNVFDDFIAAAEYLIANKYTSSEKLAIKGGSNGGLLVGACANQRPDLFRVALPAVGVMDMLRFHKFTIGWSWVGDYGSSDDPAQFEYIYKYSPVHSIPEGDVYPATLVTTADHDDRVVPAHSFKYIATLQEKYLGQNPVLIRVGVMAGHGAGKPTAKEIEENADIWSFVFYNMGVVPAY